MATKDTAIGAVYQIVLVHHSGALAIGGLNEMSGHAARYHAVAGIIRVPNVMVVHPSVPATTVPEFIAYAKANPGKISMASAGSGAPSHVSGELLKMMAGVDMVHVPYRGSGPALTDLLGGQVQITSESLARGRGIINSGIFKRRPFGGDAGISAKFGNFFCSAGGGGEGGGVKRNQSNVRL
jgi:tripartite-type tricarboxylate transporter receptor subunit TctC